MAQIKTVCNRQFSTAANPGPLLNPSQISSQKTMQSPFFEKIPHQSKIT